MTREQLEHAIRAACDVADDSEVWVFGSQAILGEYPHAPDPLRQSMEVDVAPKNHVERVDHIDGALGELSQFHRTFGFYVHGVPVEAVDLPDGWRDRTVAASGADSDESTGWCLEVHDLAASKLAAFRPKDRDFVRVLIVESMVSPDVLRDRVSDLTVGEEQLGRILRWIDAMEEVGEE